MVKVLKNGGVLAALFATSFPNAGLERSKIMTWVSGL